MESGVNKIIIIGSGPAGLTAAIYAARAGLAPVVAAGPEPGGQLTLTTEVEDFPGFPNGVQGPELMDLIRRQAERFGTLFINESVTAVNFKEKPFILTLGERQLKAMSVIIATGASARWLGLESEQRLIGHGVSSCAVCDGYFFKNKRVIVVGGGDTAFREALHLSKLASEVILLHRRQSFRAQTALADRLKKISNIIVRSPYKILEILGENLVAGVRVINVATKEEEQIDCHGLFVAIGHKPNTDPFRGQLELDEAGYIVSADGAQTSVSGVFAAGDVSDPKYRQAVTAAGRGCAAAMEAEEYLEALTSSVK